MNTIYRPAVVSSRLLISVGAFLCMVAALGFAALVSR